MEPRLPLIVILGPTGSGKSDLAIKLAELFNGEIISADSRAVYKGLDIGTAKPPKTDQEIIKHHLIDLVEPDTQFNVAEYKSLATKAIDSIRKRGKIPFLVGGSGLYIYSVIYDYRFGGKTSLKLREKLNSLSVDELKNELILNNIKPPKDDLNPRRLIRSIETKGKIGAKSQLLPDTLLIGFNPDRDKLRKTIKKRVEKMVGDGLVEELKVALKNYGWEAPGLKSPGYIAFIPYLRGEIDIDDAKERFVINDMNLARRQKTWFSNNESIHWVGDKKKAVDIVTSFLNK